jgi:hypothetical protein
MNTIRPVSRKDAVAMLAFALVLAACQGPAKKGVAITIPRGGASSGEIDRIINEAIAQGSDNDGSTPDRPLDLIIKGLDFENALAMANLFSALQKYYVNLAFGPGSGTIFKAPPCLDTLDKSKILSIALHSEALEIGPGAFRGWTGLTTVKLPCVITVGSAAFYNCVNLKAIHLPAANFVGDRAFWNCAGLETISLPVAVSVGESAFHGCANLEKAALPELQALGYQAFSNTGNKAIELVFILPYPPKVVDASGARITAGANLFGGSPGKRVTVNAPAYFGNYETWGKKDDTDTERAALWGDGITVSYTSAGAY